MKVAIIEDERLTAEDLAGCIARLRPGFEVSRILYSVKEAKSFFAQKPDVQLIFSDIHLGDGISFEIFAEQIPTAPIVFCTAYDQYAIQAFKANGIDYVLKPFKNQNIEEAIQKFERLTVTKPEPQPQLNKLLDWFSGQTSEPKQTSILVHYKDKIIPFQIADIALFFIRHEVTHLVDFEGKSYAIDQTLDEIDQMDASFLFRANRQYILNRKVVKEVIQHFGRKLQVVLLIPFDETILVSKERSPVFLKWLEKG